MKRKTGIKRKITTIIVASNLILIIFGIGFGYILGNKLLLKMAVENYDNMAKIMATHIAEMVEIEANHIGAYAASPLWKKQIADTNAGYENKGLKPTPEYFSEMDKKWSEADTNSPLVKGCLDNYLGVRMQGIAKDDIVVDEIFITDRYGGLAAISGKTTDFYQADEGWWQAAYAGGKGGMFIGDVALDNSTKKLGLTIAVPIRDSSEVIIGICKAVIDANRFFGRLEKFKIGRTGGAVLLDANGGIVCDYHSPESLIFLKNRNLFISKSPVASPILSENNLDWQIAVFQDYYEALAPLHTLVLYLVILVIILLTMMSAVGYIFGARFARPIHELHLATERIMKGDLDYKIEIRTRDEIEQYADAFNTMISNIKAKQEELVTAKNILEDLTANLEDKVGERTAELSKAQEAMLNILEDVTESKEKLEDYSARLEQALKIKSDFTSTVSHELRTPLTAIKEGLGIVLDGTAGPIKEEQKEFLEIAKRNVDRLARLINDILDLQKLEAGKMAFNIKENDINEIVKESAQMMGPMIREKGLELIIDLEEGLPGVQCDRDKIIQVLTNLVSNAVKFTGRGSVTLATFKQDGDIRVSVKDTGPGIKPENLPKLFQRFEQFEKGTERKTGGTGLGLSICKEFIEHHGGKIWAESELMKGTIFSFSLPCQKKY